MVSIVFGLVRVPFVEFHLRQRDGRHQGYRGRVEWNGHQIVQGAGDSSGRTDVAGTQRSRGCCGQQLGSENREPQPKGPRVAKAKWKWRWRECTGNCQGRIMNHTHMQLAYSGRVAILVHMRIVSMTNILLKVLTYGTHLPYSAKSLWLAPSVGLVRSQ